MYILKLGLWERIQLNLCLPRDTSWVDLEQLVRISKVIGLTDEEKKSIDFQKVIVQTHQGTLTTEAWDGDKLSEMENLQEFKLKAVDFLRLKKDADARVNWPRVDELGEQSLALKVKMEAAQED